MLMDLKFPFKVRVATLPTLIIESERRLRSLPISEDTLRLA